MAPHDLFFGWIEAPGFVEDRQRNTGFADVMQGCRDSEPLNIRLGESDLQCECDGYSRDQQAMLERSFVIAADIVKPAAEPVLLDTVDDLRCGIFRV